MKITKARLQQIIKEEVENHLRENENILEFDETKLAEASGESDKKDDKKEKESDKKSDSLSGRHLKHLAAGIKDPNCYACEEDPDHFNEEATEEDQLHKKDSGKEVIPVKTKDKIKVELKSC